MTCASPLPMPGMSVTLRAGSREDVGDALGVAFDGGGAVAIAANAEAVLARDLHEVGGFPEHARDFLVLQIGLEFIVRRVRPASALTPENLLDFPTLDPGGHPS